jgi:catechol 2,3-dioxygenase-like lactoylglutathione lyase family enzyme
MTENERRLRIAGIHHITLISGNLERSAAFYRDLLGLRLVEAGVNQDDPNARHFWFGDAEGAPGTLVTLFEYPHMERGAVGVGSTHHFAFRVGSEDELEGWRRYLTSRGVPCTPVLDRDRFKSLYVRDPDGHIVEIATDLPGFGSPTGP